MFNKLLFLSFGHIKLEIIIGAQKVLTIMKELKCLGYTHIIKWLSINDDPWHISMSRFKSLYFFSILQLKLHNHVMRAIIVGKSLKEKETRLVIRTI